MERRKIAYEVTRLSETPGYPALTATVTQKAALVYKSLVDAGSRGITCRDWNGYDLRHFLRALRNKGIGIDREWEKNGPEFGGQHGRWKLRHGHSHKEIPYPKKTKPTTAATVLASNSIDTSNTKKGGSSNGLFLP